MKEQVFSKFSTYIPFLQKLEKMEDSLLGLSIKDGKWSIKEIISHIYRWDLHFLEQSIPRVLKERAINYPSYHDYNKESEIYAKTIEAKTLLQDSIQVRKQLLHRLPELETILFEPITINGYTNCPSTNEPFTLINYIEELVEHDNHHVQQIEEFLSKAS
ncbi:hypothetical protein BKP35_10560 [Anaerobacillus arseniciselenatis]|uniref:DinB-like domain-containing protein n=1 Tax=Anaerobacillus arseniciselenatis TaxID=85682 RepID=A0A1S2LJN1_9BACI|nr:DinB family protein [Anaerobacillus arseniciselenatis]OIJ12621.1 hypothetical protein BKP35_10560 [Anaerobacillus arseniciselenatis]